MKKLILVTMVLVCSFVNAQGLFDGGSLKDNSGDGSTMAPISHGNSGDDTVAFKGATAVDKANKGNQTVELLDNDYRVDLAFDRNGKGTHFFNINVLSGLVFESMEKVHEFKKRLRDGEDLDKAIVNSTATYLHNLNDLLEKRTFKLHEEDQFPEVFGQGGMKLKYSIKVNPCSINGKCPKEYYKPIKEAIKLQIKCHIGKEHSDTNTRYAENNFINVGKPIKISSWDDVVEGELLIGEELAKAYDMFRCDNIGDNAIDVKTMCVVGYADERDSKIFRDVFKFDGQGFLFYRFYRSKFKIAELATINKFRTYSDDVISREDHFSNSKGMFKLKQRYINKEYYALSRHFTYDKKVKKGFVLKMDSDISSYFITFSSKKERDEIVRLTLLEALSEGQK